MNEITITLVSIICGVVLGLFFYGGLWFTIKKGLLRKGRLPLFFLSFMIRMLIVITGFYMLALYDWRALIFSLGGFIFSRILFNRMVLKNPAVQSTQNQI